MKERPILMSAPMVRAILEDQKTQTRRMVKPPQLGPQASWQKWEGESWRAQGLTGDIPVAWRGKTLYSPYGVTGDRLWVKETYTLDFLGPLNAVVYRADKPDLRCKWKSSLFMRRYQSRMTLEITGVRVERLQDISGDDCSAEGIEPQGIGSDMAMVSAYRKLWESINGKDSWAANPWVWVISFKRIRP